MSTEITCILKNCINNEKGICIAKQIQIKTLGSSTLVCWNYYIK
jgi:hypothetical protein